MKKTELTREQRKHVSEAGFVADSWYLAEQTKGYIKIVHKNNRTKRTIRRKKG